MVDDLEALSDGREFTPVLCPVSYTITLAAVVL